MAPTDKKTPASQDSTRSPWLVIVIVTIIILGIAAFLVLRPGGSGATTTRPKAAAPADTQH